MNLAHQCAHFIGQDVEIVNANHYIEGQLKGVNAYFLFVKTESAGYGPESQIAHVLQKKIGYIRILSSSS